MTALDQFPIFEFEELLSALKPYQSKIMLQLKDKNGAEEAAKIWLNANGPSETQKFGGSNAQNPNSFWEKFTSEFRLFICDKKYKKEREELLATAKPTSFIVVTVISGYIGSSLGFAPSFLAPAVAMLLYSIGKVGINAWCKCD